jgi:hypothetical protein
MTSEKRPEANHVLLVGGATAQNVLHMTEFYPPFLSQRGSIAVWWSCRLSKEHISSLMEWPYLYIYRGLPEQKLIRRFHVIDHDLVPLKQPGGIKCPWPDQLEERELVGETREGSKPTQVFRSWLLADRFEALDPSIGLDELETTGGSAIDPSSLNAGHFGLWRLKSAPRAPEIAAAIDAVEEQARGLPRGQGFRVSPEERVAIENHSMKRAISHYSANGWTVEDVHTRESYDLRCRSGSRELRVEVKGTTSSGSEILLTPNEVRHAQHYPNIALFIVAGIQLTESAGTTVASGGHELVYDPWEFDKDALTPVGYTYAIPKQG